MDDQANQEQSYRLTHMTTIPHATENKPIESDINRNRNRNRNKNISEPVVMLPDLDDNGDPVYKYTEMVPGLIKPPKKWDFLMLCIL